MLVILIAVTIPRSSDAQSFSTFLSRVYAAGDAGRRASLVDSLLQAHPVLPYIENDSTVHVLLRRGAASVAIAGDENGWDAASRPLSRVADTDLWYRTFRTDPAARIEYKFVVDGSWILDPRNPHTYTGGFGPNSELRMPAYTAPVEVVAVPGVQAGRVLDTLVTSTRLGNSRTVRVYLPPGYEGGTEPLPVAVVHDGPDYITQARMPVILDNMIHAKRIRPVIAVFVPAVDRNPEYSGTRMDAYAAFITEELLPALSRGYRISQERSERATIGASNGGNIALFLATRSPQVFGAVAAQSSNVISRVSSAFRDDPLRPLKVFLDLGRYDIPVLVPLVRGLAAELAARGYDHRFAEVPEGHTYGSWRARLPAILEWFFPPVTTSVPVEPAPSKHELGTAWPHPVRGTATIPVSLRTGTAARLDVLSLTGHAVATLHAGWLGGGSHRFIWDARDAVPGLYLLRLHTGRSMTVGTVLVGE